MFKRCVIITLLFFTYTIVLAHGIVPHHHHHGSDHDAKHTSHHHDDHHAEDENILTHSFENYLHSGNGTDFHQQPGANLSLNIINAQYLIIVFDLTFKTIESVPMIRRSNDHIPIQQHCLSSKGLRAPPSALV